MAKKLIDGVTVKQLKVHCDERGRVMEMIRRDDRDLNDIRLARST